MKILFKSQKEMPGIKAIPVPAEEEAPEDSKEPVQEEPVAEAKEEPVEQIQEPKRKRRTKAEIEREKGEKAAKKAEKEQEKLDLKARVRCPVCNKGPMSQHALLYTHKCCETDLKKLPKAPTLEEKFPEPTPPVEDGPPARPEGPPASPPKKRKKAKVIAPPSEESELDDWPEAVVVPPPPPLVRQPAQMSYREILEIRRAEMQRAKAHREVGAIRAHFRR